MPFLDHLEELRARIIRSLGAVVLGFGVGFWMVQQLGLVNLLKRPIAPYLLDGKLIVTSPTEPVMIVFKLSFLVGLVLASPVILWQLWAFLAPALYEREKKALVPSLFVGLLLFLTGAVLAYLYVVPQALRVLFSFQTEAIAPFITYDAYFGFVLQVVLALGISFELPLIIIILSWLGVIGPGELNRFRRYAVVLAFIAGAVLSPGADLLSMLMMTLPLILLYEVGVAGAAVIHRRRRRAALAALVLLGLGLGAAPADGQVREPRRGATPARGAQDTVGADRDTLRDTQVRPGQALDSATAQRLGLPTAPARGFAPPDSVMRALMERRGYAATRYRADSATVFVEEERVRLEGEALTERQGALLEADTISYGRSNCLLDATGDPHLFDRGQVMVGVGIRYNTCVRRGVITDALTNFQEGSTVWFLRGNVAQDSSASRIYAGSSEITSCDLPQPHYQFAAREVKWISRNVLVARPVTLYVRDVPVLWLPFIFQDMRPGRRSGILVPQFGINDLIRPSRGYNRQVTNVGYYWAPNDYMDVTGRLDWFANRYLQYGATGSYRWLNRFMSGTIGVNEQREVGGSTGLAIRWDHRQTFDVSTSLNLDFNYASNTRVVRDNAIDPLQNTQQITSSLNFSKRYGWGTLTLGGNRRQDLSNRSVQQLLPALTLSPVPIALGSDITWSPGLSFTNNTTDRTPLGTLLQVNAAGGVDTIALTADSRVTALNFDTPVRFGSFNWSNSLRVTDETNTGRETTRFLADDPSTPDPTDSVLVDQTFTGRFQSTLDWDTGINLPVLFRGSWKLQPVVGIANAAAGQPFMLRNRNTGGDWVQQGKRFRLGASASPTLFGFFPGIGPVSRIRHSFSPVITYNYEPAADVPEDFARAVAGPGRPVELRSPARQQVSVSLSQTFEGKRRPAEGDTLSVDTPKIRLLSISTSAVTYDFEQAKEPGRTGWVTDAVTNSFLSDLLPGFNLSLTHDLWEGAVGVDTARFDPFLQSVNASFSVSGNTFRSLASIFGLGGAPDDERPRDDVVPPSYVAESGRRARPGSFYSSTRSPFRAGGRAFTASFNYTLSRARPDPTGQVERPDAQNLGFNTSFSPTPFWSLSWSTQYNITDGEFESQVVRLERDLHEWRAGFNFVKNANGNFAFYFSIYLTDLPDLKFDYDQTTFEE